MLKKKPAIRIQNANYRLNECPGSNPGNLFQAILIDLVNLALLSSFLGISMLSIPFF